MATSGPRQTLLLFCKFLTHRVRTDHFDLFYNFALEFHESPPCFTRVNEMLFRVFPLVAILPIEITDESMRSKADRGLQRMYRDDSESDEENDNELRGLGTALRDRITIKNWEALDRMYSEFQIGSDRALRAFVALQPQAIAILPIGDQSTDKAIRDLNRNATNAFAKTILLPVFKALGEQFFMELDAQPERIHWWWYREPVVDLIHMTSDKGLDYCLRYLRTQNLKLHPTPQPQFDMKTSLRMSSSASMWSTLKVTKPVVDALVRLQAKSQPQSEANRKTTKSHMRPRAPPLSSDDDSE